MRWFTNPTRICRSAALRRWSGLRGSSIDDLYSVRRYIDAWRGIK